MTSPHLEPDELALIAADDELLSELAAGRSPADGDEVTGMLAAWRDDIGAARPTLRRSVPAAAAPARDGVRRRRPLRRSTRIMLGATAAVAVLAGGTAVAASDARPDSPLWPVARVLYPEHASSAVAVEKTQTAIDEAEAAIDAGDAAQAQRLLEAAVALIDEVTDPDAAARLQARIQALLAAVRAVLPSVPPPPSGGLPLPTGIVPTGILPSGGILPTGILPTGILPTGILPTGILPSGLLPSGLLPSGILPSCLPLLC